MRLDGIDIIAYSGLCLVSGELHFDCDRQAISTMLSRADLRLGYRGGRDGSATLALVTGVRRDLDGLCSASRPLALIMFDPLPRGLLHDGREYRSTSGRFGWVQFSDPASGLESPLSGDIQTLTTDTVNEEDGLRVRLHCGIKANQNLDSGEPMFGKAELTADFVVPWAFLTVQHRAYSRTPAPLEPLDLPEFSFTSNVWGVAIATSGLPCFKGHLSVQGVGPTSPCVTARLNEDSLVLQPAHHPTQQADGFARVRTQAPKLQLHNFGCVGLSRLLEQGDDVKLELSGSGLGQVDQLLGYSAVDGRLFQPILTCQMRLQRRNGELSVAIEGELGSVVWTGAGRWGAGAFGRIFSSAFVIPVAYLVARGIRVPGYLRERADLYGPVAE
jgi:hypothetical protein